MKKDFLTLYESLFGRKEEGKKNQRCEEETGWLINRQKQEFYEQKSCGLCGHMGSIFSALCRLFDLHSVWNNNELFNLSAYTCSVLSSSPSFSLAALLTGGPCDLPLHIGHLKDHSLTLLGDHLGFTLN